MVQFFKFFFASLLGVFVAGFIGILMLVGIVTSIGQESKTKVSKQTVLTIDLKSPIAERSSNNPFEEMSFSSLKPSSTMGLNELLASIKQAKTDENISGIYLPVSYVQTGWASTQEIRDALLDFKTSKKFIIAYSEYYTQSGYYLASVADKIYLNPEGSLIFEGFASTHAFFKGSLDKLDIETQFIRVGTHKSFGETYTRKDMSPESKEQSTAIVQGLYAHYLKQISESRNISTDSLRLMSGKFLINLTEDALTHHLVDALKYEDEVLAELKELTGRSGEKEVRQIAIRKYQANNTPEDTTSSKDKIAIIYGSGEIELGEGQMGSEKMVQAIRKAHVNKQVKAIVLRINSPGGSALASDVIWREVDLASKSKPLVASFGDVAASGGYYIAAPAHAIIAQPNTITGSIGVFGLIPNLQKFYQNKLGVTFDGVKTSPYADMGTMARPLTSSEKAIIQKYVNNTYQTFLTKVATGRKKTTQEIDQIGQGRVWTGQQALKIGLIDSLGSIQDAIVKAANLAGIANYSLISYPKQKSNFERILHDLSSQAKTFLSKESLGKYHGIYQQVQDLSKNKGIQARMPYDLIIE